MLKILSFIVSVVAIPIIILLTFRQMTAYPGVPKNITALISQDTTAAERIYMRQNGNGDGFTAGTLWMLYARTHDEKWLLRANAATEKINPPTTTAQVLAVYANGYAMTKTDAYKSAVITHASLITPESKSLNADDVELISLAAMLGGKIDQNSMYAQAKKIGRLQANRTLPEQIEALRLAVMLYRETKENELLDEARREADKIITSMPSDYMLGTPHKSPLLTAKTADAMLELSTLETDQTRRERYKVTAEDMLFTLSLPIYLNTKANGPYLLLRQGQNQSEADYYFIRALSRLSHVIMP